MDIDKTPRKRRGWRLSALVLLCGLVLGAAAGLAVALRIADTYKAQAIVLVSPLDGNPYSPNGNGEDLVNLETEAQLAASDAVADMVAQDVQAPDPSSVLGGLQVNVPPNTQIVEITYTARQASSAERRAQSFATSYLQFRTNRAENVVDGRATNIEDEIGKQTTQLNALLKTKGTTVDPVRRSILQEQIDGATKQIGKLRTNLTGVRTINADPGQVISPARIVSRDPQTTRLLFGAAGALAGVVIGLLLLIVRGRSLASSDPRLDSFDVESVDRPAVQQSLNA